MIGTVGLISYVIEDLVDFAIKNVGLFKTSACPNYVTYILSYLKSAETTNHIEKCLAGSTQKYISLGGLRKIPIKIPTTNQLREFNSAIQTIISHITNLISENQRLKEL